MNKIKILYVIGQLGIGGAELQLHELTKKLDKEKYKPIVCCLSGSTLLADKLEREGIQVFVLPKRKFRLSTILKIVRLIRRERVKIVHTYLFAGNIIGLVAGCLAGAPIRIGSCRSMEFLNLKHRLTESLCFRLATKIISNSKKNAELLAKYERLNKKKIITIYNGVNLQKYSPQKISLFPKMQGKEKLGLPADTNPIIGIVANLSPSKNHKCFLSAASIILKEIPSSRFLIVGDGPQREELKGFATELGIRERVVFAGIKYNLSEIISLMDIVVLSSIREGLPSSILEAMAMSKPLVVTNVGGNAEAVVNGRTGFVVASNNPSAIARAAIKILKDKGLAEKMGQEGRKRVEKYFSSGRMVKKTETLYENLLKSKKN